MRFGLLHMGKAFLFCAVLLSLFSSGVVVADEWSVEPSVSLNEEYNDNIRFTAAAHPGVLQSRLTPGVRLSNKTEVSEISGTAQMSINQYAGDPLVKNTTDQFVSLLTRLQEERNMWLLNASYKQDSTAESERLATGIVQVRTQRSVLNLSPTWSRVLTERSLFKLDYNYQDVKYDEHINLYDYTYQQVLGTLQYQLSEQDKASLVVRYVVNDSAPPRSFSNRLPTGTFNLAIPVIFGADAQKQKTSTTGIQANETHMFSETLKGDVLFGLRSTQIETAHSCKGNGSISPYTGSLCWGDTLYAFSPLGFPPVLESTSNLNAISYTEKIRNHGYTFSANLEKNFDTARLSGFASRDTNPSGSGLVETDKFGVSLNQSLTENLTGAVDVVSYRTRYISAFSSSGSRYFTFEPKLNWRFTEWWTLDAGYRYARSEQDSAANAITANAVYLNLTYNWPKMAISR